jgi:hypothetical protein
MDAKLLKEFEEMEGLSNENLGGADVLDVMDDKMDDDDPTFRPIQAHVLSAADIYYEVSCEIDMLFEANRHS